MENFDIVKAELELNNFQKEIANLFEGLSGSIFQLEQLNFIQSHVNKFGITADTLLLINQNDELANFLNISLPSCESIEEGEVFDPSSIEISEESFGETAKKIVLKIAEYIKEFVIRLMENFKLHVIHAKAIGLKLSRVKKPFASINESKIDKEAFETSSVRMIDYKAWNAITKEINENWKVISETNFKKLVDLIQEKNHREFKVDVDKLNNILECFGYQIKISTLGPLTYYNTKPFEGHAFLELPEKKEELYSFGWDFKKVKEGFNVSESLLELISKDHKIQDNLEQMMSLNRQMYAHDLSNLGYGQTKISNLDPNYFRMVQSSLGVYSHSLIYVSRGILKLISWFGSFANSCNIEQTNLNQPQKLLSH